MNPYYLNEQDTLAENVLHEEELVHHLSRLAFFRISTWKLSRTKPEYKIVNDRLRQSIRDSLLRFVDPGSVLDAVPFGSCTLLN